MVEIDATLIVTEARHVSSRLLLPVIDMLQLLLRQSHLYALMESSFEGLVVDQCLPIILIMWHTDYDRERYIFFV